MESSNKYDNGKIYKLWSLETNEIYVGSTIQPLHKRLYEHRSRARKQILNYALYTEMNKFGIDTFNIELIEDYPCKSLNELQKKEGYWIRELQASLNKIIAGRTSKEYRNEHKEQIYAYNKTWVQANAEKVKDNHQIYRKMNTDKIKEKQKLYQEINQDKLLKYAKEYRDNNVDKIKDSQMLYRMKNKEKIAERSKVYREINKDKLTEKSKIYRENNKDEIYAKKNEKHSCLMCGGRYTTCHKALHERSVKHQNAMNKH